LSDIRDQTVLPWRAAFQMSWSNVHHRTGRFLLIFAGIAVVVAFLMSAFTFNGVVARLAKTGDVHVQAMLEKAGLASNNALVQKQQSDRETWLLVLSCVLCVVVITNTMLMSVMERTREIGTLKCLGALDGFIVRVFLIESICVGLVSSVAGAVGGYLLTLVQLGCLLSFGTLWDRASVAPLLTGLPWALLLGTLITVAAAAYPAFVAARMRPVDAMRAEV
jgi:putative ABC transport system permease protein